MTTRLSELRPGQSGVIRRLGDHPLSAKLTEMGCLPGEWIRVIRIAPPGDPMSIEILGYQLALRRIEAEVIEVDVRPGFPQHLHSPIQNEK
ncbi:MAG: ferrous iron transport protein A [Bacteroidota bacterium]